MGRVGKKIYDLILGGSSRAVNRRLLKKAIDREDVHYLASQLNQPAVRGSRRWKLKIVDALGRQSGEAAFDVLAHIALGDEDDLVRARAARALGVRGAVSCSTLEQLLSDESQRARIAAIVPIGETVDIGRVRPLIAHLEAIDSTERSYVAIALGRLGGSEASTALIDLLEDPDWGVRSEAASSLARAGEDAKAVEALRSAVSRAGRFERLSLGRDVETLQWRVDPASVAPSRRTWVTAQLVRLLLFAAALVVTFLVVFEWSLPLSVRLVIVLACAVTLWKVGVPVRSYSRFLSTYSRARMRGSQRLQRAARPVSNQQDGSS